VLLTQRKRRQILKLVLPLLIIVWAAMPGLPCCQVIVAAATENSTGPRSFHSSHGNSLPKAYDNSKASAQGEALSTDQQDVGDQDTPAQNTDTDSAATSCADVEKNHHEVRGSACLDIAHVALVVAFLPLPAALVAPVEPPGAPPPPIQRRPLHLSKSVLLI
jgi:hypothetical protein